MAFKNTRAKNSKVLRIDPELEKIINRIMGKNILRGKLIRPRRITLAMARQYKKYPNLIRELEEADLK